METLSWSAQNYHSSTKKPNFMKYICYFFMRIECCLPYQKVTQGRGKRGSELKTLKIMVHRDMSDQNLLPKYKQGINS